MNTQLLCTFAVRDDVQSLVQQTMDTYTLAYNYLYVLQNKASLDELFVTYNINSDIQPKYPMTNTILIHRKKESNTLYTINALNKLIQEENGGMPDPTFMVNWQKFRNCIILTGQTGTRRISTKIFDIIKL